MNPMPPREFRTEREKREELKTYRELGLRRDLKSVRQRRRVEADGKRRVLGDGSSTQPYLIVETARYRAARLEAQKGLLLEARASGLHLPVEKLLEQLAPRIEALVYAELARGAEQETLRHHPVAALGRALTTEERARFAASEAAASTGAPRGRAARTALNQVLGQIEERQSHNPARYQMLWAQAVGAEAAQQSYLDRVDPATQTAWFRCTNSVLSSDLQRRRGLTQALGRALGVPVRQLRAKF
jgi:hypothetical protein